MAGGDDDEEAFRHCRNMRALGGSEQTYVVIQEGQREEASVQGGIIPDYGGIAGAGR